MIMMVAQKETGGRAGVSLSNLVVDDPAIKQRDGATPPPSPVLNRSSVGEVKIPTFE